MRVQDLRELTMMIFHSVSLIDYHILPSNLDSKRKFSICTQVYLLIAVKYLCENSFVLDYVFVSGK